MKGETGIEDNPSREKGVDLEWTHKRCDEVKEEESGSPPLPKEDNDPGLVEW